MKADSQRAASLQEGTYMKALFFATRDSNDLMRSFLRHVLFSVFSITAVLANSSLEIRADENDQAPIAGFVPKKLPTYLALGLYGISAAIHWIYFFIVPPRPRYMLSLPIGMLAMTIGFILRLQYIAKPSNIGSFIQMDLFILLSPCLFLATDYMLLSRLAATFDEKVANECLLIRRSLIVKIFVWSDVSTFLLQASGGGLSSQTDRNIVNIGNKLTMVGLVLQAVSFLLFTVSLFIFGMRIKSRFPEAWSPFNSQSFKLISRQQIDDWRILYYLMCVTCVGISIRSIFRIAEFAGGFDGYLAVHEGYFYIFDALPLWISMSLFCLVWPVRVLNTKHTSEHHEFIVRR
ncbi:RTA1 like protein-domain-containing protein [Favolaschia claudopus]|uniref:RTA1 like protein-domain-containing protein n=1 Tax=Favolaschia claudopus TaxID=2862362 RepID=A0AAV9ZTA1_9AGAR